MSKPEKYAVVVQTLESKLLAINARVNTVKTGYEIGRVEKKYYVKTLKESTKELFDLLLDKSITEYDRVNITNMLTQHHDMLKQAKKSFWKTVGKTTIGILTIGMISIGSQI